MHLVDAWLTAPTAVVVEPTERHARTMASLLALQASPPTTLIGDVSR